MLSDKVQEDTKAYPAMISFTICFQVCVEKCPEEFWIADTYDPTMVAKNLICVSDSVKMSIKNSGSLKAAIDNNKCAQFYFPLKQSK